jgi:putative pyruvate formate lyase activating enzyme
VFCQNYKISSFNYWKKSEFRDVSLEGLFEICNELVSMGVNNINFVSPTPYSELLVEFLKKYKKQIPVPIVWNSNGYEKVETIKKLDGLVDVYLPDLKYFERAIALKYSLMPNYFDYASESIKEMQRQVGWPKISKNGLINKGLVIRHLVLPGCIGDSKKVLDWIYNTFDKKAFVSLMSQYYPTYKTSEFSEINRTLNKDEHEEITDYFINLGFDDGLTQDLESADCIYTPEF